MGLLLAAAAECTADAPNVNRLQTAPPHARIPYAFSFRARMSDSTPTPTPAPTTCTTCGLDLSAAKRFKDSKGRAFCEPCAAALRAKAAAKLGVGAPETRKSDSPAAPEDGTFALADEPAPARAAPAAGRMELCPDCSTPLGAGPICASCGYNRVTGMAIGEHGGGTPPPAGTTPDAVPAKKKRKTVKCVQCGYDLAGLKEPLCPECGTLNSKYARAKAEERQTLRAMYIKPAIMAAIGLVFACAIFAVRGLPVGFYLLYYAAAVPVGFVAYVLLSIAFIGFDEPLGVTFVRIAAVLAVADACTNAIDAIPYIGWYAWPLEGFIYTGLLMSVMELDFEDARIVALVTFILHLGLFLSAWYVWVTYF